MATSTPSSTHPAYRAAYADFLRSDFPRIPFPEDDAAFTTLAALGSELVEAHLLRAVPKRGLGGFVGKGDQRIEAVRYSPVDGRIHINATQGFADVPPAVWNFTIGGYQVLDKYLKSRRGRVLSLDEIENVEAVANVLAFTIDRMTEIDVAIACRLSRSASRHPVRSVIRRGHWMVVGGHDVGINALTSDDPDPPSAVLCSTVRMLAVPADVRYHPLTNF